MDWWFAIKIIWGGAGLALAMLILIVLWRARGAIAWNVKLRKEFKALAKEAESAPPARKKAILLIIETCRRFSGSLSPEHVVTVEHLRGFIQSIAACFHPEARRPELQISVGRLIRGIDASLYRFDHIIHRPGMKRINTLNIKTIHGLYRWSSGLFKHPWVRWYVARRVAVQRFTLIRLLVIPDPLSWILFLSRKLLVLVLMKNLLVDVSLFVGQLALNAFDGQSENPLQENRETLETVLEDLAHVDMAEAIQEDPEISVIRQELVGFPAIIMSNPSWQDWKTAVRRAAELLARRHFPNSENPLEEAAIGPLLARSRSWLSTLGKGNNIVLVRSVYQMRLETLFQARDISDLFFMQTVRGILRSSMATYGWLKWPLKIYRRVKRFSLPGIAADVGWVLGKKSALALIYGRTFDQACRELDWVYRASAGSGPAGKRAPAIDSATTKA